MKTKFIRLVIPTLVLVGLGLVLYYDWGDIFGKYLLPNYPGLVRLGKTMGFPTAFQIAWEGENSILFLGIDPGPGGYFYQYLINENRLKKVYPNFRAFYFQLSPNKKEIGFTGWLDKDSSTRKLWVSELAGQPVQTGQKTFSKYDLNFFGWLQDGISLILDYNCQPKIKFCIGIVDKETQSVSQVYEIANNAGPTRGYEAVAPGKVIFVSNALENAITELDILTKKTTTQSFGDSTIGEVKPIPSIGWLVGLIGHDDSAGGQLFFISEDYKCEKEPFKGFTGISQMDVLETKTGPILLLADRYGYLYTLNLTEALKPQSIDQFFNCNN